MDLDGDGEITKEEAAAVGGGEEGMLVLPPIAGMKRIAYSIYEVSTIKAETCHEIQLRIVVGGSAGLVQHEDGRLVPDGAGHRRGVQPLRGLRGAARHRHARLHRLRALLHAAEPRQDSGSPSVHYTHPPLQARPWWSPAPRFPVSRPAATAGTTSSTPSSSLPTTPFLR